jgi:hypothetical protein
VIRLQKERSEISLEVKRKEKTVIFGGIVGGVLYFAEPPAEKQQPIVQEPLTWATLKR